MSLTNHKKRSQLKSSLISFFSLSAYSRFLHRLTGRRSDSSISNAESIQSSRAQEQGSTGDCLPKQRTEGEILSFPNLKAFTFNELKSATRNFCSLIGEGAFGYVFKGWIDEQTFTASKPGVGMVVAVKQLDLCVYEGHNEWLTEIRYLGQLCHPNLVRLIGFCSDGDNRLLVYEFMPRGSLEKHLFGRWVQSLSWATRIKVAIGVAKGLAFLHDAKSQIIYGDVQSSNILLDSDFNAKLSDFRLASAVPFEDVVHAMQYERGGLLMDELDMPFLPLTQVTEAFDTGHLYAKADVFSFGVVLLELLSGRRSLDKNKIGIEQNLVEWARLYLGDKEKLFRIMDFKLEGQFQKKVAHAMVNLVLSCIDNEPKLRPCMSEVSAVLEKLQDP